MDNETIARILREIAIYLEMDNVQFKPRAYEKAAEAVLGLNEQAREIYNRGGIKALQSIPGVGVSIAESIEELLKTGKSKHYQEFKKKIPVNLSELSSIEGLGPKGIKRLYDELGIKNIKELESAAGKGKVRNLPGFGEKSEEKILKGIEFLKKSGGRLLLSEAFLLARQIEAKLNKFPSVEKVMIAGSLRRRKEPMGDIDILVVSKNPEPVMDFFTSLPEVIHVYAKGGTKSMVKLKNGLDADLRVVLPESYGSALNYFIGSKDHNIGLREIAIKKGWKLNEYGLFSAKGGSASGGDWRQIAGKTEEELYKKLGLDYIEPELREMTGELESSKNHKLPKLIGYGDIQGDLQVQTNWTDGAASIEEMALAAAKAGLGYIAITDHTKRLAMTHGLDEKRIQKQWQEIDRVNKGLGAKGLGFRVLKGTECDILKDGSLDLPDEILAKCDIVGISVHSLFNLPRKDQTERIKRAMSNPHADILFHPTGRIVNKREPYDVDVEELIRHSKQTKTVLEINSSDRFDLKDEYIKKCVEMGVGLAIDSDAHHPAHFEWLEYGIAQARRGWAEKKDVINSWPIEKMLQLLK